MIRKAVTLAALFIIPIAGQAQTPKSTKGLYSAGTLFMAAGRAPDGKIPAGSRTTLEFGGGVEWVRDYSSGISFGPEVSVLIPAIHVTGAQLVFSANAYLNLPKFGLDERLIPRRIHLGIVTTEHRDGTEHVSYMPGLSYGIGNLMGEGDGAAALEFRGRVFRDGIGLTYSWGIRASVLNVFQ